MKRNMQGRKAKEKNKEQNLEIRQHSEQCEDKEDFSKTRQHEGGYDKIDMSYAHQKDEKSEKTLSRVNEKRDEKYNMFYEFLLTVECVFQGERQIVLGDIFACENIEEYGSSRNANNQFSLLK
jgi:hypothetical protein